MLNILNAYAKTWKFDLNKSKTYVLISSNKKSIESQYNFHLDNEKLKIVEIAEHVGIPITSQMKCKSKIEKACKKGRGSFYSIIGFGSRQNALNPVTTVNLYKKVVLSSALYGCETWSNMTKTDNQTINIFQHRCLKVIQNLPLQTRSVMVETLVHLHPITSEINKRKLLFLQKLCNMSEDYLSKQIFLRRLFQFQNRNNTVVQLGFIPDIYIILKRYNLNMYIDQYINSATFPSKAKWKQIVKHALNNTERMVATDMLNTVYTLSRFRSVFNETNKYWEAAKTQTDFKYIRTLLKIITRLPDQTVNICEKCNMHYEDLPLHILTECTITSAHRELFMDCVAIYFPFEVHNTLITLSKDELLLSILGKHFTNLLQEDSDLHNNFILLTAAYAHTAYNAYNI